MSASAERTLFRADFSSQVAMSPPKLWWERPRSHPRPGIISRWCATAARSASILTARLSPRFSVRSRWIPKRGLKSLLVGGSENSLASFEGKIDEVALFDRALGAQEIARHFAASLADGAEFARTPRISSS